MTDIIARRLLATTDAEVWATEFLKVVDGDEDALPTVDCSDVDLMVGWFANAIETAQARTRGELDELREIVRLLADSDPSGWDDTGLVCELCGCQLEDQADGAELGRHSPRCPYRLAHDWGAVHPPPGADLGTFLSGGP